MSAALVFLLWYPGALASATGVTEIFLIILAVDVAVGPLITLIVFNLKKPELRRDLMIVLILQLAALFYGLHAVFAARPVYLVFAADRFDLVYANELTPEKLAKVQDPRFQSVPLGRPQLIAAKRPDDKQARADILFGALAGGDDLPQLPQYYVPLQNEKAAMLDRLQQLDKLKEFNRDDADRVSQLMKSYEVRLDKVGFVPVRGKVKDLTAVIDRDSGKVLDVLPLQPWN